MNKNNSIEIIYKHPDVNVRKTVVIKITGKLPPGSKGNSLVSEWDQYIQGSITKEIFDCTNIVFDFLELIYIFGDVIASLFIRVMNKNRKAQIVVIAQGETKRNLLALLDITIPVMMVESYEELEEILI